MLLETLQFIGMVIALFVSALFVLSIVIKRNDIADTAWGIGIMLVAFVSYARVGERSLLMSVLVFLATLWGVRLSMRILLRNIRKSEDPRYRKWRDEWGKWFYPRSYLQVYLLQGTLMIVVGYSFIHASIYGEGEAFGLWQGIGLVVWMIGYFFEVAGDWQLDRFLKRPESKGKIMRSGLWKYSRHPNYFGEVTMWWGIWLMVATLPYGYWALVSPLVITFLILKVSGIPMLEARFVGNPEFEAYKRLTSAFIPLPQKRNTTPS